MCWEYSSEAAILVGSVLLERNEDPVVQARQLHELGIIALPNGDPGSAARYYPRVGQRVTPRPARHTSLPVIIETQPIVSPGLTAKRLG